MLEYCARKIMFDKFPDCIKAINVTFQHGYQHGTSKPKQQVWYSGKHGAPGFKTEIAVGPDGQARYVLDLYPGSYHDFKIFKDAIDKHLERLVKDKGDQKEQDNMLVDALKEQYQWGALLDKGYIGAQKYGRFIVPSKRKPKKTLSPAESRRNAKIKHNRVIVENYFGRMKKLWGYMDLQFRLDPKKYNAFFKFCVGLTNYHVSLMPLCWDNGSVKHNYHWRIQDQMKQANTKQKAQQEMSQATRKAQLDANTQSIGKDGELLDLGNSNQWSHTNENQAGEE